MVIPSNVYGAVVFAFRKRAVPSDSPATLLQALTHYKINANNNTLTTVSEK